MATLINGDGNAAVYAAQDSDWFAGVEGNTTKILKVGAKMEYEIEDANTIAIKNGVLVTKEGRRVQIDAGAIDEFIIPTGTQGVTRYFIIGYHLYTDASSNQLCETFVQLMANDTDTIPEDTFRGGSTDVYVSLYRVKQDGISLDTIQSLLPEGVDLDGIGDEIDDIKDDITQINSNLTELKRTILWQNPNPSQATFASQDITLASNGYDMLVVVTIQTISYARYTIVIPKGMNCQMDTCGYGSNTVYVYERYFTYIDDTHYTVSSGKINGETRDDALVPYIIYGIKLNR